MLNFACRLPLVAVVSFVVYGFGLRLDLAFWYVAFASVWWFCFLVGAAGDVGIGLVVGFHDLVWCLWFRWVYCVI